MESQNGIITGRPNSKNTNTYVENYFSTHYEKIKSIAEIQLCRLFSRDVFNATELVHETYLKLTGNINATTHKEIDIVPCIVNSMRNIIVDNLRKKCRQKRGSYFEKTGFSPYDLGIEQQYSHRFDIDNAIDKLNTINKRAAEVVLFRYFLGFNIKDTAKRLNICEKTVKNDWVYARTWLKLHFKPEPVKNCK